MERLALAVGLIVAVAVLAVVLERRTKASAPTNTGPGAPAQLDRSDFARPDAPWLVVAFSSATCLSCASTWEKIALLESDDVAVHDVVYQDRRDLHDRYRVDAVPLVLIADRDGVVRASFAGPPPAADLWAALAQLREG
jgi:hypothetical protein